MAYKIYQQMISGMGNKGVTDTSQIDDNALNQKQSVINGWIGKLTDLTTTVKSTLVAAINEIVSSIPANTSDLTNDSGFITSDDIPTIPSKTSDLNNDSGFITSNDIPSIPSKTSDLNNDSGFITSDDIPSIPSKTSDLNNDSGFITSDDIPSIPSKTSDLNNDSGFITSDDIPTIPTNVSDLNNDSEFITSADISSDLESINSDISKLKLATFPLVSEYLSTNNNGTYEYGEEITPSIGWSAKRDGEDVTVESATKSSTTSLTGTMSADKKSFSVAKFRLTSQKTFGITVSQGGQQVVLPDITWTPSYYRYFGQLNAVPTDYVQAIKDIRDAHSSTNKTKELSITTTFGSTNLPKGKYYLFAVKHKSNTTLVCRDVATNGKITNAVTGSCSIPLENGYNNQSNTYDYILVPASTENAWNFKITNS